MGRINLLDKHTINQIAAGEVIERPASVVKELLENSIDAGATCVTCEIKGGGIELIRITDNGCGIESDDVRTAFLRHATSKITDASDLELVRSLGFRGEALASIASVSDVELITKTKTAFSGTRYRIASGEELAFEDVGCPDGTTFIIRDLFGNVPVRRKFLKSAATEAGYVNDAIERIALSHPEVSIKFICNGRNAIFTTGSNSVKNIIYGIYGREIANQLVELEHLEDDIRVTGYIAKPSVARGNRNLEIYCVNGRYIRSNIISKAIEDAYSSFLMQHKYPFTAILIDIPSSKMDVNVHPTKQEVRFEDGSCVYRVVYNAVFEALSTKRMVPEAGLEGSGIKHNSDASVPGEVKPVVSVGRIAEEPLRETAPKADNEITYVSEDTKKLSYVSEDTKKLSYVSEDVKKLSYVSDDTKELSNEAVKPLADAVRPPEDIPEPFEINRRKSLEPQFAQLAFDTASVSDASKLHEETKEEFKHGLRDGIKIVGQVFNTYWIVEKADEMYIIDQHAAHEKVIFERLMKENSERSVDSQLISPAIVITLSAAECEIVASHLKEFEELGFTLEFFGGREYSLSSAPIQLYGIDPVTIVHELIDSFATGNNSKENSLVAIKERLATCACKAAVKGNSRMSFEEAKALIEQLLELDNPFNCPHGRPVIISMTSRELEKKFKRIL